MVTPNFIQQQRGLTQQFNTIIGEHEQAMKDIATSLAGKTAIHRQESEQRQKDTAKPVEQIRDVARATEHPVQWSSEKIAKIQPDVSLAITNTDTKPQLEQFLAVAREKSKALETYDSQDIRISWGTGFSLLGAGLLPIVLSSPYPDISKVFLLFLALAFVSLAISYFVSFAISYQKQKRYKLFFLGILLGITSSTIAYTVGGYPGSLIVPVTSLTLTVLLFFAAISLLSLSILNSNQTESYNFFVCGLIISLACFLGYLVTALQSQLDYFHGSDTNWILLNSITCFFCFIIVIMASFRRRRRQLQFYATILQAQRLAEKLYERDQKMTQSGLRNAINSIQQQHSEREEEADHQFSLQLTHLRTAVANYNRVTQMSGLPWNSPQWQQWQPVTIMPAMPVARLGNLTLSYHQRDIVSMPIFVPFPGKQNLLLQASHMQHQETTATVQSLLLHLFATCPAGMIRCTFIDPISFGQDVSPFMQLARYNESLITGRVWMDTNQIARQLSDISEYIRLVNAQQLLDPQLTIEQYNTQHLNAPLPYRILVVFGFPCNFTPEMIHTLKLIARYGPRCGICTLLVYEPEQPQPMGFDISDFARLSTVITWEGEQIIWDNVRLSQQGQSRFTSQTSQDMAFQFNRQAI